MPPSGTATGTEPDCPAALRLRGPGWCVPVGRIRHLCRHPASPRVLSLTSRRHCAGAGLGGVSL
ncbi:hypothetical protein CWM54_01445 [Klebsiella sp. D-Nf1]|nr:hypothetical protein CWM62_27810 [Klebsiella sp. C-Nf10]PJX54241.1 hypothetical protein CWM54_01445 [Klebsiella sp. D-Nf1]